MTLEEVLNVLVRLLDDFEQVLTENGALRVVLKQGVPRDSGAPSLSQQVEHLLADIKNGEAPNPLHERFELLRRQIRKAAAGQNLAELSDLVARAKNQVN